MIENSALDAQRLRPYSEPEVVEAMVRLTESPMMELVRQTCFPSRSAEQLGALGAGVRGWHDFQEHFIAPAIDSILAQSSDGFSISGFERIGPERRAVFVSNHRDIVCDAALFTFGLHRKGWESPFICLGDNLLVNPFVVDLVKMNRGVTVKRGLPPRELLRWSHALSWLVTNAVTDCGSEGASVWIAQREGRAKDGSDETHPGVLKMLALASDGAILDALDRLHLTPVAVSYEYDPCDALKARELYLTQAQGSYQKEPGEDVRSMALGIRGYKGRIHIEIGEEVSEAIAAARALGSRKEQLQLVASRLDQRISELYRRFPTAWIARDLLDGRERAAEQSDRFSYTAAERAKFEARMEKQLDSIHAAGEVRSGIRLQILEMYARVLR